MVVTSGNGLMTIERIHKDKLTNRGLPARVIEEIRTHVVLQIVITNFSKESVSFTKNMLNAVDTEPAETIIAHEMMKTSAVTDVTAVLCKESESRWRQMERHRQAEDTKDKERKVHNC